VPRAAQVSPGSPRPHLNPLPTASTVVFSFEPIPMTLAPLLPPGLAVSAESLNAKCFCTTLNPDRLEAALDGEAGLAGFAHSLRETRPHLFSSTAVFVSGKVARTMAESVAAIESVIANPHYQAGVLARAPEIARIARGPLGVFMGYDFHLTPDGPRLIEINTNAGGALLNLALARAQQSCCAEMDVAFQPQTVLDSVEQQLVAMFREEWRLQRGDAPVGTIALVDDDPENQYLAPEFELFRQMMLRHGLSAHVFDGRALAFRDSALYHGDTRIDMVYNRLTDFMLDEPAHAALRQAHERNAVVLTPHPNAHALHADKRNLIALSDAGILAQWGVPQAQTELLSAVVPRTLELTPANAEELWTARRQWFFKPFAGFAGKAAYRGEKLTRRVWDEISQGGFIAQALVPPSERAITLDGNPSGLKFDLRAYSYAGRIQLLAARTYSGQTTNFRTPGGGFAPVVVIG
jgi:hypothetical protein